MNPFRDRFLFISAADGVSRVPRDIGKKPAATIGYELISENGKYLFAPEKALSG
jgi:hypothetical protein